jgi:uncharacterized protein (TIGR03000 family)
MITRIVPLALWALLAPAGAARAQVAVGSPALAGWTAGGLLDRRPIVAVSAYSSSPFYSGWHGSLAEPIFMTTLQTPGIYGAYSFGTGGITLTREPWFYPVPDDRDIIPAITVTTAPLRSLRTSAGVPTMAGGSLPALPPDSPARELTAQVVVRVPEDARLEFGGVSMPQTGRVRRFVSPPLVPGQRYRYDVRATWQEDGRTVVCERQANVYAGEKTDLDFLSPREGNWERELQTKPPLLSPAASTRP